jgi:hypothetical protein
LIFVRVTATNLGGESFPTPIAAARVASGGTAPVLIVNGYERIDQLMDVIRCDTPEENCPNARIRPAQMNDQSYVIQHATAIPLGLDSAVREAVSTVITLGNYAIVDWIAGQEQTPVPPKGTEVALTQVERDALAGFLASGHGLFLSGAEVAFDLNQTSSLSFLTGTLRAQYMGDDANTFAVTPSASGILSGITPFNFDDGNHGSYAVNYPDMLAPTTGSIVALDYATSPVKTAAIQYANGCQRLVYFGFPFETIYPAEVRQAVMARVLGFLSACPINPTPTVVILSPESGRFYQSLPPINGVTGGSTRVDHVDVAMVQITTPLRFLNGTNWVATQTWLSATGSATWSFTPLVSLTDGPYAVWARAWTTAGLSSTQNAVVSFTLDSIAPTAPVPITPTGPITLTGLDVTLVYSPSLDTNGVAGYNVLVDGNLYTTTATSFPLGSLSAGSHTWAVRAFDEAGIASNWMTTTFATQPFQVYLPLVMRDYAVSPPVSQCQELVANGGFESQAVWYSLSSVKPTYVTFPTHSDVASLSIGYTTTANAPASVVYSSIQQTVTIPLTATQTTLMFWRYPVSGDTIKDFQYVAVGPTPTDLPNLWKWRSNEQAWITTTIDLSAYTGTLTIRFGVYNDGAGDVTAMYLDDVSVQTCSP